MKSHNYLISFLMIISFASIFCGGAVAANAPKTFTDEIKKIQTTAGSPSGQAVSLEGELSKITSQTGIKFQISTDISHDKVAATVLSDKWNIVVKTLLIGYNWVAVQEGDTLKTVIITGKKAKSLAPDNEIAVEQPVEPNSEQEYGIKMVSAENRLDVANGRKVILEQYEFR